MSRPRYHQWTAGEQRYLATLKIFSTASWSDIVHILNTVFPRPKPITINQAQEKWKDMRRRRPQRVHRAEAWSKREAAARPSPRSRPCSLAAGPAEVPEDRNIHLEAIAQRTVQDTYVRVIILDWARILPGVKLISVEEDQCRIAERLVEDEVTYSQGILDGEYVDYLTIGW